MIKCMEDVASDMKDSFFVTNLARTQYSDNI